MSRNTGCTPRISLVLKKAVRLGGRFYTPVLDNTIKLPYLRTTPGTQKQKGQKRYPIEGPRTSKTIPYSAARTYIAHIWEYPPGALGNKLTDSVL